MSETIFSLEKIEKQLFRHGDTDRRVVFLLLLPGPALLNEDVVLPEQRERMNDGIFLDGVALHFDGNFEIVLYRKKRKIRAVIVR